MGNLSNKNYLTSASIPVPSFSTCVDSPNQTSASITLDLTEYCQSPEEYSTPSYSNAAISSVLPSKPSSDSKPQFSKENLDTLCPKSLTHSDYKLTRNGDPRVNFCNGDRSSVSHISTLYYCSKRRAECKCPFSLSTKHDGKDTNIAHHSKRKRQAYMWSRQSGFHHFGRDKEL